MRALHNLTLLPLSRRERIEEPALSLPKGGGLYSARDYFRARFKILPLLRKRKGYATLSFVIQSAAKNPESIFFFIAGLRAPSVSSPC
jgi:hypothetical protein